MSGTEKKGRWRVGRQLTAVAVMGGNDIDLRHAEIDADEVTIVAIALMGGIDIYVPDAVDLEIGGFAFMGGTGEKGSSRASARWPRIRILAYPVMGGIDIWRLPEEAKAFPSVKPASWPRLPTEARHPRNGRSQRRPISASPRGADGRE